ncbi:hypothetical protein B0G84_3262 [Paraburkholderia sp. BL8N3]|nr:hypothetical protein [Paraburkholderia sp. BL8N3]TCK37962.1 hypothetical protein B0G84_3262 [Paraburkholderia sp. BL8N3]
MSDTTGSTNEPIVPQPTQPPLDPYDPALNDHSESAPPPPPPESFVTYVTVLDPKEKLRAFLVTNPDVMAWVKSIAPDLVMVKG